MEGLVKQGIVINAKNTDGWTPLHYAVNNGSMGVTNTLLMNGADVTQVTNKGNTPLHIAVLKGYKEIVEILLQHVSCDKLIDFIDAGTTTSNST
ncbi:ankyrin repeat domain-containing protein [Wolbachia endosymbiont of Drosophila simulans]|uniref:ankyrin repeat domain-containing protein n=1 Tax=Wolbachia endosymbiont of Drosophila simulans TaxID=77038 RepID=UPI00039DF3F2|nr:ankyrin repeat domain-containing protein [Wolbachia endosymbiont of Drosophila simulans]